MTLTVKPDCLRVIASLRKSGPCRLKHDKPVGWRSSRGEQLVLQGGKANGTLLNGDRACDRLTWNNPGSDCCPSSTVHTNKQAIGRGRERLQRGRQLHDRLLLGGYVQATTGLHWAASISARDTWSGPPDTVQMMSAQGGGGLVFCSRSRPLQVPRPGHHPGTRYLNYTSSYRRRIKAAGCIQSSLVYHTEETTGANVLLQAYPMRWSKAIRLSHILALLTHNPKALQFGTCLCIR